MHPVAKMGLLGYVLSRRSGGLRSSCQRSLGAGMDGATTIYTSTLKQLLWDRRPIVIDTLLSSWGRSIPGAVGLERAGRGGSTSDRSH
jgi:hypothetical protein